jgi:hypothetical protein
MSEDAFDKLIKEKVYNFSDRKKKGTGKPLGPNGKACGHETEENDLVHFCCGLSVAVTYTFNACASPEPCTSTWCHSNYSSHFARS